ncbi:MAG: recombination mediator RecR [Anaerolineae bacterium]|nr:recombination mediator RecR [Anaerolineae bacterium]NUQ06442.1 recombination protein RecR [Anaerolineae bacterium]
MSSTAVPPPVTRLIDVLSRLPGVGPKTASRLTYFLLRAPDELSIELSEAVGQMKTLTRLCSVCYNITVDDPCPVCSDAIRDQKTIAVVEEPLDVLALERTNVYRGVYHVLHGAISYVNGVGPEDLRIRELVARVEAGGVNEIIIATNPGLEGDATAMHIQRELAKLSVTLTRLARGLPVGGDIEYADSVTLMRALQGRSDM